MIRVDKNRDDELKRFEPLHEAYLKSEKYIELQKQISDAIVDEEEYKKDVDPEGYSLYADLVSFATNIGLVEREIRPLKFHRKCRKNQPKS